MNQANLKPFTKGISGNPSGRPKGSVNLSSRIRNYLETTQTLTYDNKQWRGEPLELLIGIYTQKAIDGDLKAATWLAKFGYGTRIDTEMDDAIHAFIVTRGQAIDYTTLSDKDLDIRISNLQSKVQK
jgi:hypothetical protein